jgi:hypothetical protein|tara:strand:- start:244 stop:483 length:240 start_codon:yes stop_codon:yes gene_type:complete
MDDYANIFEILDAIKDAETAIEEAIVLKREMLFAGEPMNEELSYLYRHFVQLIDYNIRANRKAIQQLQVLYKEWRDEDE